MVVGSMIKSGVREESISMMNDEQGGPSHCRGRGRGGRGGP